MSWKCPRCEQMNKSEWPDAIVDYQKCNHCEALCDVQVIMILEGVELIE